MRMVASMVTLLRSAIVLAALLTALPAVDAVSEDGNANSDAASGSGAHVDGPSTNKDNKKPDAVNLYCCLTGKKISPEIEMAEVTVYDEKTKKPLKIYIGFANNEARKKFAAADKPSKDLWIKAARTGKIIVAGKLVDPVK
ncbi:hypothetical protein LBMAG53_10050 [Planctomycetota bacterium]|nr:hypothetical protein LBMAG53_10050 [Planctomycetota bacterium]